MSITSPETGHTQAVSDAPQPLFQTWITETIGYRARPTAIFRNYQFEFLCNGQKEVEHKELDYRVTPTKAGISSGTTLILCLVGMAKWTGQIVQPVTDHYRLRMILTLHPDFTVVGEAT
ncbi:MAG: hypothetical protein AAF639_23435, partial [Chloroflexota bacterium]